MTLYKLTMVANLPISTTLLWSVNTAQSSYKYPSQFVQKFEDVPKTVKNFKDPKSRASLFFCVCFIL